MLAIIRPDDWNLPLLVHVFGAMMLVGTLATSLLFQVATWRGDDTTAFGRLAFRTLLYVALPSWFVMRIGAEWIYRREGWEEATSEPAWLVVGYVTADLGGLLLLLAIILGGLGAGRLAATRGRGRGLVRASTVLVTLALVAYIAAVWAMSGKPD